MITETLPCKFMLAALAVWIGGIALAQDRILFTIENQAA